MLNPPPRRSLAHAGRGKLQLLGLHLLCVPSVVKMARFISVEATNGLDITPLAGTIFVNLHLHACSVFRPHVRGGMGGPKRAGTLSAVHLMYVKKVEGCRIGTTTFFEHIFPRQCIQRTCNNNGQDTA